MKPTIITPQIYLMGRDKDFPLDMLQARNMADFLSRANFLFATICPTINYWPVLTSGYRPPPINKSIAGAKMSTHTVCAGGDFLDDSQGIIGQYLFKNQSILIDCGLYLEHPDYTISAKTGSRWVHLDTKPRNNRVFIPY